MTTLRLRPARPLLALAACLLLLSTPVASAQETFGEDEAVRRWSERLAGTRNLVDRVVICFDKTGFLEEIALWDSERFWPVLLWDPGLVPLFIDAFRPQQILAAKYAKKTNAGLDAGMRAVAASWGIACDKAAFDSARLLDALRKQGRAPLGAVLVADDSPELLGGIALAAGRLQLPLPFATVEKQDKRVPFETVVGYRDEIARLLGELGIAFDARFDDLDFLTVANGMPFGYTLSDPARHGGGYTIDDALARGGDDRRWGWTGRLAGGPAQSIYMVMCSLFLQPEKGLFFSRYNPAGKGAFAAFDPLEALDPFNAFFPCKAVRHPDATLERWRAIQWPRGNRYGFVYVNSSGGATNWSTSRGGATHFDIPLSIPAVVHYTHSGSASRPFQIDTIAGRWMANGAYVYFGSYAEPYLGAFIPPKTLAARVKAGVPLGAAMRHLFTERARAVISRKEGEKTKEVTINVTAPWKLAYFGDPSYRLTGLRPERIAPGPPGKGYYATLRDFRRARPGGADKKSAHPATAISTALIESPKKKLVDKTLWARIARKRHSAEEAALIQREMVRVWTASLRRAGPETLYSARGSKKLATPPTGLQKITAAGAASPEAGRLIGEFAKEYIAGIAEQPESDVGKKKELALRALHAACCFEHTRSEEKQFFAWIREACAAIGVPPGKLHAAISGTDWITPGARRAAEKFKGEGSERRGG